MYEAQAEGVVAPEPEIVMIEVEIEWTRERIIKEIVETFPESHDTAIAIALCESGLRADVQSGHTWQGERERSFGIFQIHSDSWHATAMRLGYEDYRTDPGDNIKMARYIYDNAGKRWSDWSCYTKKMI